MKRLHIFLLFAFTCLAASLAAQDIIVKHNGDSLLVKVVEVGTSEVKYRLPEEADGPLYGLEKFEIRSIRYKSGRTEYFEVNPIAPEPISEQKVHAIKLDLLSPVFGYTKLSYEHSMKPGRSIEASVNIIGLGNETEDLAYVNASRDARGVGLSVGYKFIKQPDYYVPGMRLRHVMHGAYAKPTLHVGFYSENYEDYDIYNYTIKRRDVAYYGGIIELGKQWVFGNVFLIDLYLGLGLGGDTMQDGESGATHWSVVRFGGENFGGLLNGGFKVGVLLGKPKPIQRPQQ
jgi:hypothetical protein